MSFLDVTTQERIHVCMWPSQSGERWGTVGRLTVDSKSWGCKTLKKECEARHAAQAGEQSPVITDRSILGFACVC
jgi:hypothetical protein